MTGNRASGKSGSFMPRRTDASRAFDYTVTIRRDATDPGEGHSRIDPSEVYTDQTWGLLAQTVLDGVVSRQIYVDDAEHLGTELATRDGASWALIHHDREPSGFPVRQAGPRQLWDELEELHQQWTTLGRPAYHRFGLTVGIDQTVLWLDHPDSGDVRRSTAAVEAVASASV